MISTDLFLKGLGGVAVVGGATGVGVWYFNRGKTEDLNLKELVDKVGLVCTATGTETLETGINCTKKTDEKVKIKVKKGTDSFDVSTLPAANGGGKIKVYKTSKGEDHKEGLKFVIEGGDIAGTGQDKKLEQFETYEITEDAGKHHLTRKSEAKTEIKKALGLPDKDCEMPTTEEKTCNLDEGKLKAINFEGKSDKGLTLETVNSPTASLKIKAATSEENTIFPHGYKFTLVSNRDITLDTSKVIKKGTNTEFKIKVTPASGGPKLTLEKAWTVTALGKKVGLECPGGNSKECTLGTAIKVYNDDSTKTDTGTKPSSGDSKITFEEGAENYNQGFKFSTKTDISVSNETVKILGTSSSGSPTYEIGTKPNGTNQKWYLIKKTGSGN